MTCASAAPLPERPLKVLVLRGLDGPGGGVEHIMLHTAASVDARRVQMAICCLRHKRDELFDFDRRAAVMQLDYRQVLHSGPLDRRVLSRLSDIVAEFRPDILHSHDYKASFFATRLARRFAVRRVATAHGWTGHNLRERWVYYPADKLQLRRFPAVIAVSDEIRDTLLRWVQRRTACASCSTPSLSNSIGPMNPCDGPCAANWASIRHRSYWERSGD